MTVLFRVELYVKDIEESLTFYQNIIGLQLFGRNERSGRFNYDCFSLLVTSVSVLDEKHYFSRNTEVNMKGKGVEFIIVVDELERVYERCCKYNYPIEVEVEQYPWEMRGFKIIDPDGYFLRITSK
ncbi:VOC family protein [Robertmurraya massiliosenegalensis]|uniref:VOC family protein n=1 Tax=Robertmurraya massiliosenegalensis TaxID=1287657 RepID=UPI0002D62758|nr:VOC family protein [Robertmurraya massiliosenegalensis]